MIYALIGCLIIIGFLGFKLFQKQKIDKSELKLYEEKVSHMRDLLCDLQIECNDAKNERVCEETHTQSLKEAADEALQRYHEIVDIKMNELDASIEEQRQKRQLQLDDEFKSKNKYYQKLLEDTYHNCEQQSEQIKQATAEIYEECKQKCDEYYLQVAAEQDKLDNIQRVLRQYDADKQAKLYYTIQLPEEYQEDIEFLLTTVAAKVQHPDIISKLVWAEYVKPNLDETFKRIDIHPEPGIYKLTSLENGKCYIGKSTNIKTRIADHFKSAIGIKSIADQAVHHAILKEGFWNWTIEVITYCDKEKLNELEKYYIEFFKTQEYGWNRNSGGGG